MLKTNGKEKEKGGLVSRIGIAHGPVVAGRIGGNARQAFTVYGEAVNLAARFQEHAKTINETLVVDESVFENCADKGRFKPLGSLHLRGMGRPVAAFTCKL